MDWLGMFVPRIKLRRPVVESLSLPEEEDMEQLAELRTMGSRLDLPQPVRGYLLFPDEAPARRAADLLGKEGFRCAVRAGQDGSWGITAVTRIVPTPGAITRLREQLQGIASAHDGEYRGWDAALVY